MAKTSLHTHTRLSRAYLALARLSCKQSGYNTVQTGCRYVVACPSETVRNLSSDFRKHLLV